ncbi:hypothetical protein ACWCYZ_40770 [Streptomyces virginiae]
MRMSPAARTWFLTRRVTDHIHARAARNGLLRREQYIRSTGTRTEEATHSSAPNC